MYLTPAIPEYIAFVRSHLRPSVVEDMRDSQGPDADIGKLFDFSIAVSSVIHAFMLEDGRCVGLAGICDEPFYENAGCPWFMGTPEMHVEERGVLRCSRAMIGRFYAERRWGMLATYVSSRNPVSLHWMTKWLGFTHVRDIDNFGNASIPFHVLTHRPDATTRAYDRTLFR